MDNLIKETKLDVDALDTFTTYVSMDEFDQYTINTPIDVTAPTLSQVSSYEEKTKRMYVFSRSKVIIDGESLGRITLARQPKYIR